VRLPAEGSTARGLLAVGLTFAALVVAAATASLLGGGPVPVQAPASLSERDLHVLVQTELDRKWELTGLEGTVARPGAVPNLDRDRAALGLGMMDCMNQSGISAFSFDDDGLLDVDGRAPVASETLAWFTCSARNPRVDYLSGAQKDYIYDYYVEWLLPCLGIHGHTLHSLPSRSAFHETASLLWNPYYSVTDPPESPAAQTELEADCAPTVPGIPGWSR
jgi:hypothetical protein